MLKTGTCAIHLGILVILQSIQSCFYLATLHNLQLFMSLAADLDFGHGQNLYHETGPASKVLSALTLARLRVILFPSESSLLPALVHRLDQVLAERIIHLLGLLLVGSAGCSNSLCKVSTRVLMT